MTLPQRIVSDFWNASSSAGVLAMLFRPCAVRVSCTSGIAAIRSSAAFRVATTGAGVPAGAQMPYQVPTSKPG